LSFGTKAGRDLENANKRKKHIQLRGKVLTGGKKKSSRLFAFLLPGPKRGGVREAPAEKEKNVPPQKKKRKRDGHFAKKTSPFTKSGGLIPERRRGLPSVPKEGGTCV